jgi:hypothetical protein
MHGNIDKKILTKNFLVIFIVNTNENILLLYIKKIVARERRRGDRPPKKNNCNRGWGIYIWSMWGDKKFVVS